MNIQHRIAGQFSLIVGGILVIFSLLIYSTSATYRRAEFYRRLERKAQSTVRLLAEVKEIDRNLLKTIDHNTLSALFNEKVLVFDVTDKLVYASIDDEVIHYRSDLIRTIRQQKALQTQDGENELIGILFTESGQNWVVLASAYDTFGKGELSNLRRTLLWVLVGGLTLTFGSGIFFAGQSLRPIGRINREVQSITSTNLGQRLDEGKKQDEIERLAINFNHVLERLERAFQQQRNFVAHASHELKTPLTALKSEIQLGLRSRLSIAEHEAVLINLSGDTERLIGLSNSLLLLARTQDSETPPNMVPLRTEEVLWEARQELLRTNPDYVVSIGYANVPVENETMVNGNETLLRQVFLNLMDNACKYSDNQAVQIQISTNSQVCRITLIDTGIGIKADELPTIFDPFYRASNALSYSGFGLGLSICRRIVEIHSGRLTVASVYGQGSVFTLILPHK